MTENESGGGSEQNLFARFLDFENLIGASLIKIVYYLGLAGIALWCLFALFNVLQLSRYAPGGTVLYGLLFAIVGFAAWIVVWRFLCELWMVVFKIHDRLGDIRDRLPPRDQA